MANVYLNLPVPSSDGVGATVDTSGLGRVRTFAASGDFGKGAVTVEVSNDGAGWVPLVVFTQDGERTVEVATRFARVRVASAATPVAVSCDVGSNDDGSQFATLPAPAGDGDGAAVDVSALGTFNSMTVTGAFTGSVTVELSQDGSTWSSLAGFAQPGIKSLPFVAKFLRVRRAATKRGAPGLPVVLVGATNDVSGGGGGVPDPYTPPDGTWNVNGYVAPTGVRTANGSIAEPAWSFSNEVGLGAYRIGASQWALTAKANQNALALGDFTITTQSTFDIRYTARLFTQPKAGLSESVGIYGQVGLVNATFDTAMYVELMAGSGDGCTAIKIQHFGTKDAVFVRLNGANAIGMECSSFLNQTRGYIATLQPNTGDIKTGWTTPHPDPTYFTPFEALWESSVRPGRGLFYANNAYSDSLTIHKWSTTVDTLPQIRVVDNDFLRNRFVVYNSGAVDLASLEADAGSTLVSAPDLTLRGSYWDGAAAQDYSAVLRHVLLATTPDSQLQIRLGGAARFVIGHTTLDCQSSSIVSCGGLTMKAGGGNVDLQGGALLNLGSISGITSITFVAGGGGSINMSTGSITNAALIQLRTGGTGIFNAQGGKLRALGVGTTGDCTVSFSGSDLNTGVRYIGSDNWSLVAGGNTLFEMSGASCSVYGVAPVARQTVTGARNNPESALANLLTAIAAWGAIINNTTAS